MSNATYYQKSRDVILNRAKDYYENNKKWLREQAKVNTETYLKKTKAKRENMEKTEIIICLKKRNKN